MSEPEKCLSVGKNFSRREWLMTILILLMMQAGALTASHAFVRSQDVLNYVSFASTIASLLLAVIAIVYGFYQSESQKRTGDGIAGHLLNLRLAAEEIKKVSSTLVENSQGVVDASDKLAVFSDQIKDTSTTLNNLKTGFLNFEKKQDSMSDALHIALSSGKKSDLKIGNSAAHASSLVLDGPIAVKYVLMALMFALQEKTEYSVDMDDFAEAVLNATKKDTIFEWNMDNWTGSLVTTISMLDSFGIIEYTKYDDEAYGIRVPNEVMSEIVRVFPTVRKKSKLMPFYENLESAMATVKLLASQTPA